jgi:hypothetical protein
LFVDFDFGNFNLFLSVEYVRDIADSPDLNSVSVVHQNIVGGQFDVRVAGAANHVLLLV